MLVTSARCIWQERKKKESPLTFDERSTSAEDDVAKETLPQVEIGAVDRVDHDLVDARVLEADNLGVEQQLGRAMSFRAELFSRCAAGAFSIRLVRTYDYRWMKKEPYPDDVPVR